MGSSPNRLVGVIFGAVYILVGLLGFVAAPDGLLLGIFGVDTLHNIIHLLVGAVLLIGGLASVSAAKTINTIVGAVYLLLGIAGFFLVGAGITFLNLNTADHFLHLASAVVLLGVGLGTDRAVARTV